MTRESSISIANPTKELDAAFSVVPEGAGFAIYLESRGGRGRNPDYNERLFHILHGLASSGSKIREITVESTLAQTLHHNQKVLKIDGHDFPLRLWSGMDIHALRFGIGRAQEPIAQRVGATGGNRTKRIRIAFTPQPAVARRTGREWEWIFAGAAEAEGEAPPAPTLTIVSEADLIQTAHEEFARRLVEGAEHVGRLAIGFRGGHNEAEVFYSSELTLWMCFERETNRYWNAFGFGRPERSTTGSIVTEINSPYEGINRQVAAAFGVDSEGQMYLLHRGKVGGGRAGISKPRFLRYYRENVGALEPVRDGEVVDEVIVIGALSDSRLPAHVASFVRIVSDFKADESGRAARRHSVAPKTISTERFSPEFGGTKAYSTRDRIVASCTHGAIVNSLQEILTDHGYQTANDQYRDLMIIDGTGSLRVLFEVKPGSTPYHIYLAIGQLLLHGIDSPGVQRVAVLPAETSEDTRNRLSKLGITVIGFDWEGQRLRFYGLERLGGPLFETATCGLPMATAPE